MTLGLYLSPMAPKGPEIDGFIPMYFDQSDRESLLFNVHTISRLKNEDGVIKVTFVDGYEIEVTEDYDEFKSRIRKAIK